MRTIVAVCFLLATALAAEETTPRKSRQIITPFATSPLLSFAHSVVPQAHVVGPALHYAQPLVQAVGLAHPAQVVSPVSVVQHAQQIPVHPAAFAIHQPALQRAYGYVQAALQSVSAPTQFFAQPNAGQQNVALSNGQYAQNIGQSQLNTLNQPSSALYPQGLNTQSQSASDRSRQQNQDQNTGSHGYTQQTSLDATSNQAADNSQYLSQSSQQSASSQSDGQYNSQYQQQQSASPRSEGQYNNQYQQQQSPSSQSNGQYNSQYQPQGSVTSAQLSPRVSPQQTLAIFPASQYSGISSSNSANLQSNQQSGQVVSQPGENRNDGSYSYGIQSDNGVQSSQVTLVRSYGPSRLQLQGSYPYPAPSQYYPQSVGSQQTSENGELSSAQSN